MIDRESRFDLAIANYFIELSINKNKPITHMKLQKLLYFAHGWHLALTDKPLIKQNLYKSSFYAWRHGAILSSVCAEFRRYGNNTITEYGKYRYGGSRKVSRLKYFYKKKVQFAQVSRILTLIWETYSKYTDLELCILMDVKGNVWRKTFNKKGTSMRMKDKDIKKFFKKQIKKCFAKQIRESKTKKLQISTGYIIAV